MTSSNSSTGGGIGSKIKGAAQIIHGVGEAIRGEALNIADETSTGDKHQDASQRNAGIAEKGRQQYREGYANIRGKPTTVGGAQAQPTSVSAQHGGHDTGVQQQQGGPTAGGTGGTTAPAGYDDQGQGTVNAPPQPPPKDTMQQQEPSYGAGEQRGGAAPGSTGGALPQEPVSGPTADTTGAAHPARNEQRLGDIAATQSDGRSQPGGGYGSRENADRGSAPEEGVPTPQGGVQQQQYDDTKEQQTAQDLGRARSSDAPSADTPDTSSPVPSGQGQGGIDAPQQDVNQPEYGRQGYDQDVQKQGAVQREGDTSQVQQREFRQESGNGQV